mgnify:CR=1 FL=1
MGKKRLEKLKASEIWEKHKENKELRLIQKENQAIYQLTLRLMKEDQLTWDQVQECYK